MQTRWALIDRDGKLHRGIGPESGLGRRLEMSVASGFLFPGQTPVFFSGPISVQWEVEGVVGQGETARWWGFTPHHGSILWAGGGTGYGMAAKIEDLINAIGKF